MSTPSVSAAMNTQKTEFLGLHFDQWSLSDVLIWLEKRSDKNAFAYIVTPNVDHAVRLADAARETRCSYDEAGLLLCDSRILSHLARWAGRVRLPVVPGSDLTKALFSQILRPGDIVCVVGGSDGDAAKLEILTPGIRVIQYTPPMGLRSDSLARARAVNEAMAAKARFTLFAVGSPQQELLAHEMAGRRNACGTGMCIGASIDFLLGRERRAPRAIQRLSLEWAWRLMVDPRRLARRYLVDGPAVFPLVWRWRSNRAKAVRAIR